MLGRWVVEAWNVLGSSPESSPFTLGSPVVETWKVGGRGLACHRSSPGRSASIRAAPSPVPRRGYWSVLNVADAMRRETSARDVARLRVVTALRLALAALTFVSTGCATKSDDAEVDQQCPPGVACDCTYVDGAYYNCGKDGGIPACPANAQSENSCASVSIGALCATCSEGAGAWCSCAPADAGAQWECIGTEYPCKGP
jgi:hypothetical protein